jgi:hypothetical protein
MLHRQMVRAEGKFSGNESIPHLHIEDYSESWSELRTNLPFSGALESKFCPAGFVLRNGRVSYREDSIRSAGCRAMPRALRFGRHRVASISIGRQSIAELEL